MIIHIDFVKGYYVNSYYKFSTLERSVDIGFGAKIKQVNKYSISRVGQKLQCPLKSMSVRVTINFARKNFSLFLLSCKGSQHAFPIVTTVSV